MATKSNREGLSPKEFAAAIGVSESSIKRWVDQGLLRAVRTAGGHRRIAPDEAARWIREHRVQLVDPGRIGFTSEPLGVSEGLRAHFETFYDHLFAGRSNDARALALRLFVSGHSIAAIGDSLIAPAMARIGGLWQHSDEGVFVEHRATDIAVHVVKELDGAAADQRPRLKGTAAVAAALIGDPYSLAPMLVAAVVGECGLRVTNLGAATPTHALEIGAERVGATLVCISLSVRPEASLVAELVALVQRMRSRGVRVAIGGRHVDALGMQSSESLHLDRTLEGLAKFARSLVHATPGKST